MSDTVYPTAARARQQEKLQEIAPALGNSDEDVLNRYGVYGNGSSIRVGCNGGQLTSPDRMTKKMMVAKCRGAGRRCAVRCIQWRRWPIGAV
jgi:hypothetical protein